MVKAVVLDGFHRQTVITLSHMVPILTVPREAKISVTPSSVENKVVREEEYQLTFASRDGKVALYSTTGNSEDFLNCDAVHVAFSQNPLFGMTRELNHFVRVETENVG
jgi:hypothetical protein